MPLYVYIDICTCTHPSSFHINTPKTKILTYIFFRLGGHMAASSTYGRFNVIPWTHYHLENTAYFLIPNFRHCMIIVSLNYSLSLSLRRKL